MEERLKDRGLDALKKDDYGERIAEGFYIKDLGTVTNRPDRSKREVETADPIEKIRRKGLKDREKLVGTMAAQLMDYYIENLNDSFTLNPIRDGIPACVNHPFPPGCVHGCKENVTRVYHQTLGDVFAWVQELLRVNYKQILIRRPELRGYSSARIG